MADQDYQEYLACISQAQAEANQAKTAYDAEVKAAREAFLQKQSTETEYYNSDDEDEPLCTAAPSYPNQLYNQNPINYNSIAQNNQYLSKQNCYNRCTPKSTTSYTPASYTPTSYTASKTSYPEKANYTYSQNICNLKYIPPPAKKTFTLAYKKPIAKVYVYNNYIQNLDNCNKGPYYEKKQSCIPSTTKATYKC
tara:strand:- start:24 stop:608 length:585 start_codon:yes stop_codon:yes gene_type:complete